MSKYYEELIKAIEGLSPKFQEVLSYIARGKSSTMVGNLAGYSPTYIDKIFSTRATKNSIPKLIKAVNRINAAYKLGQYDTYKKFATGHIEYDHIIDSGHRALEHIRQIRLLGQPKIAIQQANGEISAIKTILREKQPASSICTELVGLLTKLYFELCTLYNETAPSDQLLAITQNTVNQMHEISRDYANVEIAGVADLILGDVYYIRGEYPASFRLLIGALEALTDTNLLLYTHRILALSWAFLKNENQFEEVRKEVVRLIDEANWTEPEGVSHVLEGIGRGQGVLKLPSAFDTLAESRAAYENFNRDGDPVPRLETQLARTHLEVAYSLEPTDKQSLEAIGLAGLDFGKKYPRHTTQIKRLLEIILN